MLTFTSRIVKIPSCTYVTCRKVVESRCTCITFVIHEIEFTTTYPIFITCIAIWTLRITITSWNVKNKVKKVTLTFESWIERGMKIPLIQNYGNKWLCYVFPPRYKNIELIQYIKNAICLYLLCMWERENSQQHIQYIYYQQH